MSDLPGKIRDHLNAQPLLDQLTPLFWQTLGWGKPQGPSLGISVGVPINQYIEAQPVAQLGGLPVLSIAWPEKRLPNVTQRRAVYKALAPQAIEHLLCYVSADDQQVAFVWARRRGDKVELRTLPYQRGSLARTTLERLSELAFGFAEFDLFGQVPATRVIDRLNAAFDVEAVTKKFFGDYRRIFEQAEKNLPAEAPPEQRRLYTQRFFNRLMFIAFLERKGWLHFNGRSDYLRAVFEDYHHDTNRTHGVNFHRSRLYPLFFMALNSPHGDRLKRPDYQIFRALVGDVPYLNGGLFEGEDEETWFFPDEIAVAILGELLYAYNFTITESTPLDIEVAVDPEMLGKIFEELVTGRHETGSYYTPKSVVAFMCRQALKAHLQDRLPAEPPEALEQFVEAHDAYGLRAPEQVLAALRQVRACDPACGSGAYLLGLLHELVDLRASLFVARQVDAHTLYERKLEIIQSSLYGVDLDPFAVNIARLRLWLSLIVDFEGEVPPPLPNLDFKIEAGDSLTAPDPSGGLELGFRYSLAQDFLAAKTAYLKSHDPEQKKNLRATIQLLRQELIKFARPAQPARAVRDKNAWLYPASPAADAPAPGSGGFDWALEFAEIFAVGQPPATLTGAMTGLVNATDGQMELTMGAPAQPGGFDIVLANPPYVRADAQFKHIQDEAERQAEIERWRLYRERLKQSGVYQTLHEKWDLYIPFLERAYQLLRPGGQMVFIIPDAYNAAKYAGKSHAFFLQQAQVMRIDFCSEMDLFDAGVNNTILHFSKRLPASNHQPVRVYRRGRRDEFDDNFEVLKTTTQNNYGLALYRFDSSIPSKSDKAFYMLEQVCYMSKGMVIHADERHHLGAFKTDDLISPIQDELHPRPFIQGRNIAKWVVEKIQYLEWGTERAPSMFRRQTFPDLYEVPEKMITMDIGGKDLRVIYDDRKLLHNHSGSSVVLWYYLKGVINKSIAKTSKYRSQDPLGDREWREDISSQFETKYILAIMNSVFAREFVNSRRRSKLNIYPDDWKQLPIAPLALEQQMEFVRLVDAILAEFSQYGYPLPAEAGQRVKEWEAEIDRKVNEIYAA